MAVGVPVPIRTAIIRPRRPATLQVVEEAKLATLLPQVNGSRGRPGPRLEASGVVLAGDRLVVVFDNLPDIARVHRSLEPGHTQTDLVPNPNGPNGFEDITSDGERYFALVESALTPDGEVRAAIHELDPDLRPIRRRWVDTPIRDPNKGLEGLCWARRDDVTFLLALYEGNRGHGGAIGRRGGGGRIVVLRESDHAWQRVATVELPTTLDFRDYSALSLRGSRLAVLSQASSALWVGELAPSQWRVEGPGTVYRFPNTRRVRYDAVEGVTWLDDDTLAVVSDRSKLAYSRRRRRCEESAHIVRLPRSLPG